jgi:hypothetical protein
MKAPFRIYLHEQEQQLNKVKEMTYSMRAEGKKTLGTTYSSGIVSCVFTFRK